MKLTILIILLVLSISSLDRITEFDRIDTTDFSIELVKESQTIAALRPKNTPDFDFTPADRLERRAANGYHHLGDLLLRLRAGNSGPMATVRHRSRQKASARIACNCAGSRRCRSFSDSAADIPLQSHDPGSSKTVVSSCVSNSKTNLRNPSKSARSAFR